MHYYIDGYNMIFRLMHAGDRLQTLREEMIYDLNKKVELIKIDVSIVFDAAFQEGLGSRSHFNRLEVLYTDEGESADDFIINELKRAPNPRQETIVTSDKKLAWRARRRLAHTEGVEEFMEWMNRAYKNKLRQLKQGTAKVVPSPIPPPPPPPSPIPTTEASIEQCSSYYEQIFESRFQELLKKEKPQKSSHTTAPERTKKKKKDFYPQQVEDRKGDDMARWLKAFEKRLEEETD